VFDQNQIHEYRQITAPSALKERVLTAPTADKKPIPFRRITTAVTAVAACFVLLIVGGTILQNGHVPADIALDGQPLNNETPLVITQVTTADSTIDLARNVMTARFTLTASGNITVSSASTGFFVCDGDKTTPLTTYTAKDSVTLEWLVSEQDAVLTVNDVLYTISADPQTSEVSVRKTVQD